MSVDDVGHIFVEMSETLGVVGGECELHAVVDGKHFGMVAHFLSLEGNRRQEAEGFDEIFEMDRSRQFDAVDQLPLGKRHC